MRYREPCYERDEYLYMAVINEHIYAAEYVDDEEWYALQDTDDLINLRLQLLAQRWKL